jgi:DNA-binding transcriptional ArsR family regulator
MSAFAALADPTRREIVEVLATGESRVTDLVARFPISQPAISRHLRLLKESGLVGVRPCGRERIYFLEATGIEEVAHWATAIQREVTRRFDALGRHLDHMEKQARGR